jgi:3-phenylpropionate/trans-cinnamate dioxygenase ferredoxin reductase component
MPEAHVEILLIGGGVASVRCARTLRRSGFGGSILIVGEEPHAPYNRPPLSKELLRDELPLELASAEQATWYERHSVELRTAVAVDRLDASGRLAILADGSRIRFERCLIATGAEPRRPPIPGAEHAFLLRTVDDAVRLRTLARPGVRAVVIGGGFIGIEAASSMTARGASVTILELAPLAWAGSLGAELSEWAVDMLAAEGVTLRTGVAASRVEADAVWIGDERLPADLILAGVGVRPREDLARDAGLGCQDGVVTDASHATSVPGTFAAGDMARVDGRRVEHWHAAREGGARAALAMLGKQLTPARAPWVFSEFAGQQLDVVGFAPTWDETVVLGDAGGGRFAVGYLRDGMVAQLAVVNTAIPIDEARSRIEVGMRAVDLRGLAWTGGPAE